MLEFAVIRENLKQETSAHCMTKLEKQGLKKKLLEMAFVKFYISHYLEVRKYGASIKELREP